MGLVGLDDVLDTYSFSALGEKKIRHRIQDIRKELGSLPFDELYRIISDIAMYHQLYGRNVMLSIDDSYIQNTAMPLIVQEDPTGMYDDPVPSLSVEEIIKDIDLSPIATAFLFSLLSKDEIRLLELTATPEEINERALALINKYKYERFNQVPQQDIKQVRFGEQTVITSGRRYFGGDPLAFAQSHIDVYGTIKTRTDLCHFDQSLYQSLVNHNQIAKLIPDTAHDPLWKRLGCENAHQYYYLFYGHRKPGRDWGRDDLNKENPSLYRHLRDEGSLDKVFPEKKSRLKKWQKLGYASALDYFNNELADSISNRGELVQKHSQVYRWLKEEGSLDSALQYVSPQVEFSNGKRLFRGYPGPIEYTKANLQKYVGMNRRSLQIHDNALYKALFRRGQVDDVFPKGRGAKITM